MRWLAGWLADVVADRRCGFSRYKNYCFPATRADCFPEAVITEGRQEMHFQGFELVVLAARRGY